jgi:hypothetical protein
VDPQPAQSNNPTKSSVNWKLILGVLVVGALLALVGVWFWKYQKPDGGSIKISSGSANKKATLSAKKDETAGWKIYTDQKGNFSIKYPEKWQVNSYQTNENCSEGSKICLGSVPLALGVLFQ